jgi:hypothetical protein
MHVINRLSNLVRNLAGFLLSNWHFGFSKCFAQCTTTFDFVDEVVVNIVFKKVKQACGSSIDTQTHQIQPLNDLLL